MHTELLQPWVTAQGTAASTQTIVQDEESWLDLDTCPDISAWIDVRGVTAPGTSSVTLFLESAPSKDESLFAPIATMPLLAPSSTPYVVKSVAGAASVNPTARWLRWRLTVALSSGSTGAWGATFRIRVARARTPFFTPAAVPGLSLWLRADLGLTLNNSAVGNSPHVSVWADQSGSGNSFSAAGSVGTPTLGAGFNGFPAIATAANSYFTTSSGYGIAQNRSLILVAQSTAQSAVQSYVSGSIAAQPSLSEAASAPSTLTVNAGTSTNVMVSAQTAPNIIQVDFNGASTQVFQNGSLISTINPGSGSGLLLTIGAGVSGVTPFIGSFAEILSFNPILTPTWRVLTSRYLGSRYGISVP